MIAILDNDDSFRNILVECVGELNTRWRHTVWRNDPVTINELPAVGLTHLIAAPRSCDPPSPHSA